jgi:hypothetical protein
MFDQSNSPNPNPHSEEVQLAPAIWTRISRKAFTELTMNKSEKKERSNHFLQNEDQDDGETIQRKQSYIIVVKQLCPLTPVSFLLLDTDESTWRFH